MEKIVDPSVEMDHKRLWSDLLMYIETIATCKQEKGESIEHYSADRRCYGEVLSKMKQMQSNESYVMCESFVAGTKVDMYFNHEWVSGTVISDYRYLDGIITIESDDGRKIWCPECRHDLYKLHEED